MISNYNIKFKEKQMRDILNLLDSVVITEGVGLANRKPGDLFKNPEGDVIAFQNLDFYPESGSYRDLTDAEEAVAKVAKSLGIAPEQIMWTNQPPARRQLASEGGGYAGFGIATFTDQATNQDYYLGRWFKNISPNRAQNKFAHSDIPGGFKFASKSGAKENAGYTPTDVLTQFQNNTPETIMEQIVAKFGEGSDMVVATATFMQATKFPVTFPKGSINFTAFRDYFCEILQPVALVMGKPIKGNAQEAATIFFGPGSGYGDSTISFNNSKNTGLYDSLLVSSEGKQIKLSSKGKSGANASVVNLLKSIQDLQVAPKGKKLLEKHKDVVELLQTVKDGGHVGGALNLGIKYKIITPEEANEILMLKTKGPKDKIQFGSKFTKLNHLYYSRTPRDWAKVIPLEHMLSVVAYRVADYVNEHTNFGQAASEILNHSALVQMYTEASETADTISITGFRAVYPSETVTGVLLDASKAYMSTQDKGNFTFEILKNGAKKSDLDPVDNQEDEPQAPARTTAQDLDRAAQTRSGVKASAGGVEKLGSDKTLGRKRQR
jgi:hypothetical protein